MREKLTSLIVGCIALAIAACSGCGTDARVDMDDLVGDWQGRAENIDQRSVSLGAEEMVRETVVSLRADGSYEWNTGGHKSFGRWTLSDRIVRLFTSQTRHAVPSKSNGDPLPHEEMIRVELRVEGPKLIVIDSRGAETREKFWLQRK